MKAVFHNLGLGDHILCNGLIRELYKKHKELGLFVLNRNYDNIKFMYSDLDKLQLLKVDDDCDEYSYIDSLKNLDVIHLAGNTHGVGFEKAFYERAGVDFEKKWSGFYLPRNRKIEINLFRKLGLKEGEYVFIHEWKDKRISDIDGYVNVRPLKELGGIFDFCYIIENAEEIHCMESSFKNLIEFLDLKNNSLYFYKGRHGSQFLSRLRWRDIA